MPFPITVCVHHKNRPILLYVTFIHFLCSVLSIFALPKAFSILKRLQNSGPEIYSLETLPAKFFKTFTVSLLLPHKQKPASNLINLQAWHKF